VIRHICPQRTSPITNNIQIFQHSNCGEHIMLWRGTHIMLFKLQIFAPFQGFGSSKKCFKVIPLSVKMKLRNSINVPVHIRRLALISLPVSVAPLDACMMHAPPFHSLLSDHDPPIHICPHAHIPSCSYQ
jgi:hypothetical protein